MPALPPWRWDIPADLNVGAACTDVHRGTAAAGRDAIVVDDVVTGVGRLTFAALAERTDRLAALLRALGIGPGERLLLHLPNGLAWPTVFLGAMKAGVVPVPVSTLLTTDEVIHLAGDSEARGIVTTPEVWAAAAEGLAALGHVSDALLAGGADRGAPGAVRARGLETALDGIRQTGGVHPTRAEDPAYLVYTSGTTGHPKGVLHAHRGLLGRRPATRYWFDFQGAGERVLHAGRFNWTYVLGTGLMDPLALGHTAIVREGPPDAAAWPALIARHRATTFIAVPTIYRQILEKTDACARDVPTLRHCMCAGEPLAPDVLAAWRERFGQAVYEALGMSECSYYLCQTRALPLRPGSVGIAQPGHDVRLCEPGTLHEVPAGEEGILCVPEDDPALMLRYWRRPQETADAFQRGLFVTGDWARRDADGYLWFTGRRDDLINSFGYRVSPHEVERVLGEHPGVLEVGVVGEEIAPGKVLVAAHVVVRPGGDVTADEVLAWGRARLAAYKAPRIVHLADRLPRTPNGKLLRRALAPAR